MLAQGQSEQVRVDSRRRAASSRRCYRRCLCAVALGHRRLMTLMRGSAEPDRKRRAPWGGSQARGPKRCKRAGRGQPSANRWQHTREGHAANAMQGALTSTCALLPACPPPAEQQCGTCVH